MPGQLYPAAGMRAINMLGQKYEHLAYGKVFLFKERE